MNAVLSTRRVLLWAGAIFTIASLPPPLVDDYNTLMALQIVRQMKFPESQPTRLEVRPTHRWRGMDSNLQFRDA